MAGQRRGVGYREEERETGSESGKVVIDETIPPIDVDEG